MRWKPSSGRPFTVDIKWKEYNEELVVQGEFLLDFEWVNKGWQGELQKMNSKKRGAPFKFPTSLIMLQSIWHQWIDYREIEGITRKVVEMAQIPDFNDYSTINRRVNKLEVDFQLPKHGFVSVASDGSGIKLNEAGEYREDKYGRKKQKKYIKVTISANPLTGDTIDCDVIIEGEGPSEGDFAQKHMQRQIDNGIIVDKFWGDGLFDSKNIFNFLERHGIEAAVKIRENASDKADGSMRRAREVAEYKSKGYKDWARDKQYGKRWLGTEVKFSAVKRKFGEKVRSKKRENKLKEVKRRFWAYETIRLYAKA
jgi:hypothetical protein